MKKYNNKSVGLLLGLLDPSEFINRKNQHSISYNIAQSLRICFASTPNLQVSLSPLLKLSATTTYHTNANFLRSDLEGFRKL